MRFVILLCDAPEAPSSRRALCFAQAVLDAGHEIAQVFCYQAGALNALKASVVPQDEVNWPLNWQEFLEKNQLMGSVCIAAALRYGVLDEVESQRHQRAQTLAKPWLLSGLGQLHEMLQQSDRVVCFGGP